MIRVAVRLRPGLPAAMTPQISLSPRAWAELALLALIWGASFLSIRVALNEIGPLTVVAHRTGWAALILWAYVALRRLPVPKGPRIWGAFLVMGLLNNVIPFTLMAWGQLHIETGLTSILNAATAVFGVIAAAMFFADEHLTARKAIGVALGFAGVVTAVGADNLRSFDLRSLAQLAVIGGTVSYALAMVWARRMLGGLSPQIAVAGMLTASSLVMIPAAWLTEGPIHLSLAPQTYAAIAYFAVFSTALAYLLYYRVLAMAGSGNLSLVTLLIPPVAIILGAVVLDEALPTRAYAGFAVLALGLMILNGRLPGHRFFVKINRP
jgi:drug/metabolite transporter (DMT)-like permease